MPLRTLQLILLSAHFVCEARQYVPPLVPSTAISHDAYRQEDSGKNVGTSKARTAVRPSVPLNKCVPLVRLRSSDSLRLAVLFIN